MPSTPRQSIQPPRQVDGIVRATQASHCAERRAEPTPVEESSGIAAAPPTIAPVAMAEARIGAPRAQTPAKDDRHHRRQLRPGGSGAIRDARWPLHAACRSPEPFVSRRESRHGDRHSEYRGFVLPERPADSAPEPGPEAEPERQQDRRSGGRYVPAPTETGWRPRGPSGRMPPTTAILPGASGDSQVQEAPAATSGYAMAAAAMAGTRRYADR